MAVDRLNITVPIERGAALRSLAAGRHQSVPTVVTEAIARHVRMAALDVALAEAGRKFGPGGVGNGCRRPTGCGGKAPTSFTRHCRVKLVLDAEIQVHPVGLATVALVPSH